MKNTRTRRVLSLLLSMALLFSQAGLTALAAEGEAYTPGELTSPGISGVSGDGSAAGCGHIHDDACGYIEAVEGAACSHQNDDGSFRCAPVSDSGNVASSSDADYVCDHRDACGYIEAVEGAACTHSCELCSPSTELPPEQGGIVTDTCICDTLCTEGVNNLNCPVCREDYGDCKAKKEPVIEGGTVTEFSRLDKKIQAQEVEAGTALEELVLPDSLEVSVYAEDEADGSDSVTVRQLAALNWNSVPDYTGEPGTYVFTPEMADDYPLQDGVKAPDITVTVKEAPLNGLEKKILQWAWVGKNAENPVNNEETGNWEMSLPTVNPENQASFDTVVSMLPVKVAATMEQIATGSDAEEKTEITLDSWACEAFKQDENGAWPVQGDYTFAAALPEGYALATDAKPLEIKVMLGGGNTLETGTGDFTVTGGTSGTDYEYSNNTLTIKSSTAITISGTTTSDHIVVESGVTANITLDGVKIQLEDGQSGEYGTSAFQLVNTAACNLTLASGSANTLKSGYYRAGLQVEERAALTITDGGTGSLTATGGFAGAGIGGASKESGHCGTITISGGTVIANGGSNCAGIGSGRFGNSGIITINAGTVTSNGNGGGAGIGTGSNPDGEFGTITIYGGTVIANGGSSYYGSGAGIGGGADSNKGTININGGSFYYESGAGIGNGHGGSNSTFSTGDSGNAFIITSGISDKSNQDSWGGIIFEGNDYGRMYGSPTLSTSAEIPLWKGITIEKDRTLTVAAGVILSNIGTIAINDGGKMVIEPDATLSNNSTVTVKSGGELENSGTIDMAKSMVFEQGSSFKNNNVTKALSNSFQVNPTQVAPGTTDLMTASYDCDLSKIGVTELEGGTVKLTDGKHQYELAVQNPTISTFPFSIENLAEGTYTVQEISGLKSIEADGGIYSGSGTIELIDEFPSATVQIGTMGDVSYLDESGKVQIRTKDSYILANFSSSGDSIILNNNWYVVRGNVTAAKPIDIQNDVHLILLDGCTLNALYGIRVNTKKSASFTVYGQSHGDGAGILKATGGDLWASIGGSHGGDGCGPIIINGGQIEAGPSRGGRVAGIGGGESSEGNVTIHGGTIRAVASAGASCDIGSGISGGSGPIQITGGTVYAETSGIGGSSNCDFSTGENGNAVIFTSKFAGLPVDQSRDTWSGVIFEKKDGKVYGSSVIPLQSFTIPYGYTLTIPDGAVLTIREGLTLANEGRILVKSGGTLELLGTLTGNSPEFESGSIEVQPGGTNSTLTAEPSSAVYGQKLTLSAKFDIGSYQISGTPTISFFADKELLGTVNSEKDASDLQAGTLTLNEILLKAGSHSITARISGLVKGAEGYSIQLSQQLDLAVSKADSAFTATVKKGGEITSDFTYGDTITVEVSGIQVKPAGRNALSQDYACLFATDPGNSPDASSAIANTAISNGKATLTYDTSAKGVEIGNGKTLWIAYGGSGNLNPATQTVTVNLAKADQTPTSVAVSSLTVTYGGDAPTITALTVKDSANVTYTAVSDMVGIGNSGSDVASISGTTITLNKAGTF